MRKASSIRFRHTLLKKWWTRQDAEILMPWDTCTCVTRGLHTKKPDVSPLPCRPSNWKNPVRSAELKSKCGTLSGTVTYTLRLSNRPNFPEIEKQRDGRCVPKQHLPSRLFIYPKSVGGFTYRNHPPGIETYNHIPGPRNQK